MPGPHPTPDDIWNAAAVEGERRVTRSLPAIASAAFVGGADVMVGIAAVVSVAGRLANITDPATADMLGAFVFGIGFVMIDVGRGELFTENFLIPFAGAYARKANPGQLGRLYGLTLVFNVAAVSLIAWMLSIDEVLDTGSLQAAGRIADVYAGRGAVAAFVSAILAGAVITLWTWMSEAAESAIARISIAFLVGLVVAVSSLNHVIVVTGTMIFGKLAGTGTTEWVDIARNFGIAIAGNLVGGVGLVTLTRVVQARGEEG